MINVRDIVRIVLTVVCVVVTLYLLWTLRKPIGWLLAAVFLATALSPPVNYLARSMKRGFAIAITYLGLLLVPILLISLIVPPLISEANNFADHVPQYADDVTKYVQDNETLRNLNEDYDITSKLEEEAGKLPNRLGGAAGTLRDIGLGIVNSLFALLTILVMTAFLLGSGRLWTEQIIRSRPPEQRERLQRSLDNIGSRGERLRCRCARDRLHRRDGDVHRAHDPWRPLCGPSGGHGRLCVAHPAGRRHHRRGAHRGGDRLR